MSKPTSAVLRAAWLIPVACLAAAATAHAQVVDSKGVPYRQWDVAGSAGIHLDREPAARNASWPGEDQDWEAGLLIQGDVGRYWTSHFKTELSVAFISSRESYSSELLELPEGTAYANIRTHTRRQQVGAAFTYQFFENVFAHPYVSLGVRATFHNSHSERFPIAWITNRIAVVEVPIPPRETREFDVLVRPIVAAGFKSYFNERSFIRSELSTAYSQHGLSQWALRLGFGVDF